MPVTITIKDDSLVDAILEKRGTDPLFDRLADLIDHGYHYGPAVDSPTIGLYNYNDRAAPAVYVCRECHATYYADDLHLCRDTIGG